MTLTRNRPGKLKIFHRTAFISLAVILMISPAHAQCVAGAPCVTSDYTTGAGDNDNKRGNNETCDGDFMNQIYARAFMEASRETMIAQTYIRKPDSTLEYTCFDEFLDVAADEAPDLFTETNEWLARAVPLYNMNPLASNPPMITTLVDMAPFTPHLEPNLEDVVSTTLIDYLDEFTHDFLGGTGGMNSSISGSISPGNYNCGSMAAIWEIARCQNFSDGPTLFTTFQELAAADPRQFPTLGACTSPISTQLITTARNAAPAYNTAQFDAVNLYFDRIDPATNDAECLDPIDTGVTVMVSNFTGVPSNTANPSGLNRADVEVNDKVCVNPGCYYHVDITFSGSGGTINSEECRKG